MSSSSSDVQSDFKGSITIDETLVQNLFVLKYAKLSLKQIFNKYIDEPEVIALSIKNAIFTKDAYKRWVSQDGAKILKIIIDHFFETTCEVDLSKQSHFIFIFLEPLFKLTEVDDIVQTEAVTLIIKELIDGLSDKSRVIYLNSVICRNVLKFFMFILYIKNKPMDKLKRIADDINKKIEDSILNFSEKTDKMTLNEDELNYIFNYSLKRNEDSIQILIIKWLNNLLKVFRKVNDDFMKMLKLLPAILETLFDLSKSGNKVLQEKANDCLNEFCKHKIIKFYKDIHKHNRDLLQNIVGIIIKRCGINELAVDFLEQLLTIYKEFVDKSTHISNLDIKHVQQSEADKAEINIFKDKLNDSLTNNPPITKQSTNKNISANKDKFYIDDNNIVRRKSEPHLQDKPSYLSYIPFSLLKKIFEQILESNNANMKNKINKQLEELIDKLPIELTEFNIKKFTETLRVNASVPNRNVSLIYNWCNLLYNKYKENMFEEINKFIETMIESLPINEEDTLKIIEFLCNLGRNNMENEQTFDALIEKFMLTFSRKFTKKDDSINKSYIQSSKEAKFASTTKIRNINDDPDKLLAKIVQILITRLPVIEVYIKIAEKLSNIKDSYFISKIIGVLSLFLLTGGATSALRDKLSLWKTEESSLIIFDKLFRIWSFNPISALILCIIAKFYDLSFNLILNFVNIKLDKNYNKQLENFVSLFESAAFNQLRMSLIDPINNVYLVKTIYGILMLLPQSEMYKILSKRMKNVETLLEIENNYEKIQQNSVDKDLIDKYIQIFIEVDNLKRESKSSN